MPPELTKTLLAVATVATLATLGCTKEQPARSRSGAAHVAAPSRPAAAPIAAPRGGASQADPSPRPTAKPATSPKPTPTPQPKPARTEVAQSANRASNRLATQTGRVPVKELGALVPVPQGWRGSWDSSSEIFEVSQPGRRFFIEPLDPEAENMGSLDALTRFVEGFAEDDVRVVVEERDSGPDSFWVKAKSSDGSGRSDEHFFLVRGVGHNRVLCRLGPGMRGEDVAAVKATCLGLEAP